MKKILLALVAITALASGAAQASPILLGEFSHDYGSAPGRVDPSGNDPLSGNFVTVKDTSSSRFSDIFDFSSLSYDRIDHFELVLTFSQTNDVNLVFFPEDWRVRPGASTNLQALTRSRGVTTQTFSFDSSVDTFSAAVAAEKFSLWFADEGFGANQFRLYDATLAVFGTAVTPVADPEPAAVPEPGTLALLGASLLSGLALRRRR